MNRTEFTESGSRLSISMMWIIAAIVVVAVAGITWGLIQNGPSAAVIGEAAEGPALAAGDEVAQLELIAGQRAADQFSTQLDLLRRRASIAASWDSATAYGVSLEKLAQAGRQAYVDNRLPATANGYAIYLDSLRRQGQAAQNFGGGPAGANEFSEWLDQLRRMGQ